MTNNTLYQVAKLGKPHSLRGFQYINIDIFFRRFDLSNISMQVGNEELIVENFKTHLKDRNLIKFKDFDTIESIERLRDNFVSISDKYKNDFLNDNKLPWPGFFINKNLGKSDFVLLGFNYSKNFIFCEVSNLNDLPIPYNDNFFSYQDNQLVLINDDLTV